MSLRQWTRFVVAPATGAPLRMTRYTTIAAVPSSVVPFASSPARHHSDGPTGDRTQPVPMTWILPDGTSRPVTAYDGQTYLDVAREYDMNVEAACDGVCACSTCQVYLEKGLYDSLPPANDAEEDMLDQAYMPQPTSRLACQIKVKRGHQGTTVRLPKATRNMAVDGYVSKPH